LIGLLTGHRRLLAGFAPTAALSAILASAGIALFLQASVEIWRMMYSFRNPEAADQAALPAGRQPG